MFRVSTNSLFCIKVRIQAFHDPIPAPPALILIALMPLSVFKPPLVNPPVPDCLLPSAQPSSVYRSLWTTERFDPVSASRISASAPLGFVLDLSLVPVISSEEILTVVFGLPGCHSWSSYRIIDPLIANLSVYLRWKQPHYKPFHARLLFWYPPNSPLESTEPENETFRSVCGVIRVRGHSNSN